MPAKLTRESFINKANIKHNNYYDYSLTNYINAQTKVKIICPKHGIFEQQPNNHLAGQRCIKCMGDKVREARISNTGEFILKSKKIHGDKYDYSLTNYQNGKNKVIIICPKHGEFLQTPYAHNSPSMKQGCPCCNSSKGEDEIEKYLIKNNILYNSQYVFKDCFNPKTNKKLSFDFYISSYNILIEFQGEQHYKKTGFFEKTAGGFEGIKYRDEIKRKFCEKKGIKLIEISYKDINNIENILKEKLI